MLLPEGQLQRKHTANTSATGNYDQTDKRRSFVEAFYRWLLRVIRNGIDGVRINIWRLTRANDVLMIFVVFR